MELPEQFEKDIESKTISLRTRVIIYGTSTVYLSTHSISFEGNFYKPLLLDVPFMKESVDYESRNFKISSVSLKISNYEYDGDRFSDKLRANSLLNKECEVYWDTQSTQDSSDSLLVFKGYIRRISHGDSEVSVLLEDLTQSKLDRVVPIARTANNNTMDEKYRDVPIPMAYGVLQEAPAVLDVGDVVKADSDSTVTIPDSGGTHSVWNNFEDYHSNGVYSPVKILDGGSFLHIPKETKVKLINLESRQVTPDNYQQYYDEDDNESYAGAVKLRPFSQGAVKLLQIYAPSKPSSIECVMRSSASLANLDGMYIDSAGQSNDGQSGWNNPDRFIPDVSDALTDNDYIFNSLESLNNGIPVWEWSSVADESYFDYNIGNSGDFISNSGNSAQGLIRIKVGAEPLFEYSAIHRDSIEVPEVGLAINGQRIKMPSVHHNNLRTLQIFSIQLGQAQVTSLVEGATPYDFNASRMCYLDGSIMNSDGTPGTTHQDFRPIFQFLKDGQPDSHQNYMGYNAVQENTISTIDVRRIATGGGTPGSDYGGFITISDASHDYGEYQITIGCLVGAGDHQVEFEAGIGGDWSEIDLLHTADIEFKKGADFYMDVFGRREGYTVLRNPISIIRHIAINELGVSEDDIDEDSYNRAVDIHSGFQFDFSVKDEIKAKDLFQEISKSTLCYPYFNNQGKLTFPSYKPSYSIEDFDAAKVIKDQDVINFSFNKTKLEDVCTKAHLKYDYNYTDGKYRKILQSIWAHDWELEYNGYEHMDDNILHFESPFIKYDLTAEKLWEYMFKDNQFQHLTCKVKLPLKYIHLDIGDTIKFDKLLGGMKAFGIDYIGMVKLVQESALRHTAIYPMFFVTSVTKNLDSIEIEGRQIHHLDGSNIQGSDWGYTGIEDPDEEPDEDEVEDEEEEEIFDESTIPATGFLIELHHGGRPNFWYTTAGQYALTFQDIAHWFQPAAYGLESFNQLAPSDWSENETTDYDSGEWAGGNAASFREYEALRFSIAISPNTAIQQERINIVLKNIAHVDGGFDNWEGQEGLVKFRLGWVVYEDIIDLEGHPIEVGWYLSYDDPNNHPDDTDHVFMTDDPSENFWYAVMLTDNYHLKDESEGTGHRDRRHELSKGEGLQKAMNLGYIDLPIHPDDSIPALAFDTGMDISIPHSHRLGDVDGDDYVQVDDMVAIQRHIRGEETLMFEEYDAADVNQDGNITILDIVSIVTIIMGTD